jgi:4,5-DOPA dioxygenase extradiol
MHRKQFLTQIASLPLAIKTMNLQSFANITNGLSVSPLMPILFTSHGNPMDIPLGLKANAFLTNLYNVGENIRKEYEVKSILVISAHWLTNGTFVNVNAQQQTIYDYYGFPPEYYTQKYPAPGAPEIANEVAKLIPAAKTTTDWGLDHGSWPMLKHLFPKADVPVFEMSIDYHQPAQYHYNLATQLKSLRKKGVLIIGSGAVVHNIPSAIKRFSDNTNTLYGWDVEFDQWVKQQLDKRDFNSLVNYQSHKYAALAVPTPDHYVPMLYSLGMMDENEKMEHSFEELLPAFSNRGFKIG